MLGNCAYAHCINQGGRMNVLGACHHPLLLICVDPMKGQCLTSCDLRVATRFKC